MTSYRPKMQIIPTLHASAAVLGWSYGVWKLSLVPEKSKAITWRWLCDNVL